ncbi:Uncharacterised protein [Bacteroides heparinolyticus]|uniref:Uncharacterized protein n=1 Tax=Prevotella heparinolytica TaxID=28113 RepID=A0A449I2N9_9BACE|nr:Uncharacterised protein [Bacteroides heparinolyticus]
MFYEQNNIASFKQIFIYRFLFAVETYSWSSYMANLRADFSGCLIKNKGVSKRPYFLFLRIFLFLDSQQF